MALVKEYHEPGHAVVRIYDDCILPPDKREALLKEHAKLSVEIMTRYYEKHGTLELPPGQKMNCITR